ncbi:AAA family ATPase [Clostridium felsineum]|uniref:AAA family ATPase n=1 Tax=Clostridium felsineum TaxID=36839 RepID=UPI00098BEF8A|nr:AAA family ATPase [Clostridium felsineum]URZ17987.1 hypothetical protein CLFE_040420 [Clostridium felsineum DSM 794]
MKNHYITKIRIDKLRHLENIDIELSQSERKHLLLTGKNGVGKTSTLAAIKSWMICIQGGSVKTLRIYQNQIKNLSFKLKGEISEDKKLKIQNELKQCYYLLNNIGNSQVDLSFFGDENEYCTFYDQGKFILAYYGANRKTTVEIPNGVEKLKLKETYSLNENPSNIFVKYLVDLKTQQSFARNENDLEVVANIEAWFNRLENALKVILGDNSIKLKFDYRNYNFKILQEGREPYGLNELSDGYSSILNIVSDLILRMDKNRASEKRNYVFDTEGIVMIDELETHLHIELQKKILPFLTEFFSNIQFIVTTHSPFVLNSVDNAVIYDLEKKIRLENLSNYSYDGIVEGYFEVDSYSQELKDKIAEYKKLAFRNDLNEEERAHRAELRIELKNASNDLAKELKSEFNEIEEKRKKLNDQNR